MSDSEDDLFRQAMGDVKPLQTEARVNTVKNKSNSPGVERRRVAAITEGDEAANKKGLTGDFVNAVDPHDILEFKRPGIQNGVYKNLRLGKYSVDARLDLHGLTVDQARVGVWQFVEECMRHDIRCALITHGKGENRLPQPALLKSCVAHWLPQIDFVMAFHSAQKHHGGSGATYVLLKKSEKKRLENFEKQQKKKT
ncbi:MAG: DNA endonuclease SmrA [Cellvibrionaceae bacterium]